MLNAKAYITKPYINILSKIYQTSCNESENTIKHVVFFNSGGAINFGLDRENVNTSTKVCI